MSLFLKVNQGSFVFEIYIPVINKRSHRGLESDRSKRRAEPLKRVIQKEATLSFLQISGLGDESLHKQFNFFHLQINNFHFYFFPLALFLIKCLFRGFVLMSTCICEAPQVRANGRGSPSEDSLGMSAGSSGAQTRGSSTCPIPQASLLCRRPSHFLNA